MSTRSRGIMLPNAFASAKTHKDISFFYPWDQHIDGEVVVSENTRISLFPHLPLHEHGKQCHHPFRLALLLHKGHPPLMNGCI
jgi:hypothetical protein